MASESRRYHIYTEIASQPEAWSELLPLVLFQTDAIRQLFAGVGQILLIGCGSGFNASIFGAPVLQAKTGIPARAVPAADVYLFPESILIPGRREVAVLSSRSGQTTEVINALYYLKDRGIPTLGVTCSADSPLAQDSDLALVLSPVAEQAVVTSRSLTGMLLTLQLIAAIISGDKSYLDGLRQLPEVAARHMPVFHELGQRIGQQTGIARYAFVGNGPFYGIACECQLKIKEMALLPSDSYPMLDFRHGPQSNVDGQMLITAFLSDNAHAEELRFLDDMRALGGQVWSLCGGTDPAGGLAADHVLKIDSTLDQYARGPLCLPAVQYMAYYRALSRGLNPDEPRHLDYWIDTAQT